MIKKRKIQSETIGLSNLNDETPQAGVINHIIYETLFLDPNPIGRGKQGYVLHGKYNGSDVAVKVFNKTNLARDAQIDSEFVHDIEKLFTPNHPNVQKYLGISATPKENLVIISPFMSKSIKQELLTRSLSLDSLNTYYMDICMGMNYLHSVGIIHPNFTLENILINVDGNAIIADYAPATLQPSFRDSAREEYWMYDAPELHQAVSYGNTKHSNVWSYGIILLLLNQLHPYEKTSSVKLIRNLKNGSAKPNVPKKPDILNRLCKMCFVNVPEKRGSFAQIEKSLHDWNTHKILPDEIDDPRVPLLKDY